MGVTQRQSIKFIMLRKCVTPIPTFPRQGGRSNSRGSVDTIKHMHPWEAAYCALMPASLTCRAHIALSAFRNASNSTDEA